MESPPRPMGTAGQAAPLGNSPVSPGQISNALAVCIEEMGRIIPELESTALNLRRSAANLRRAAAGLRSLGAGGSSG